MAVVGSVFPWNGSFALNGCFREAAMQNKDPSTVSALGRTVMLHERRSAP